MTVNAFGHGDLSLPYPEENFSNGPDPCHRPSCCSGNWEPCDEYDTRRCHDNCCCCDPCRHATTDICRGGCCHCVPRWVCATFTPNSPTAACRVRSFFLEAETPGNNLRTYWGFNLPTGGKLSLSVGEVEYGSDLNGYADCSWRLETEYDGVLDEVALDHSGDINCMVSPGFSIDELNWPYTDSYGSHDCIGSLTFSSFLMDKVPFVKRFTSDFAPEASVSCGACSEVCTVLSVGRGNTYNDTREECEEFNYIDYDGGYWAGPSGQRITLVEVEGVCYLELTDVTPLTFKGDLIRIDPYECAVGMNLTAEDYDGNYIQIGCNPCSCWKHVCGSCRCVCPALCVVGMESGYPIEPMVLAWDPDLFQWGDEYFSIALTEGYDGGCQVEVTGFDDPIPLPEACSPDVAFVVATTLSQQIYDGGATYYSVSCSTCEGLCGAGSCLDICDDVPQVLFATVSPQNWMPAIGCDDKDLCFVPFSIPLALIYAPDAAGKYRWQGQQVFSCKGDCFDTEEEELNYIAQIDIGCDGLVTFTVLDGDENTIDCTEDFEFALPCGPDAVWDLDMTSQIGCGEIACCAAAGFSIAVSE